MKSTIKHGAIVRCDLVTVVETETEVVFRNQCSEKFVTYSVSRLVRQQASDRKWLRVKAKLVRWPGQPPIADGKKVDVCPKHAKLVMTEDDHKAKKKAAKEKAAAAKPKAPRKKLAKAEATATGAPF
jgi:hypothetical protein